MKYILHPVSILMAIFSGLSMFGMYGLPAKTRFFAAFGPFSAWAEFMSCFIAEITICSAILISFLKYYDWYSKKYK